MKFLLGFWSVTVLLSAGFPEAREDSSSGSGSGREGAARGTVALGRVKEAVGFGACLLWDPAGAGASATVSKGCRRVKRPRTRLSCAVSFPQSSGGSVLPHDPRDSCAEGQTEAREQRAAAERSSEFSETKSLSFGSRQDKYERSQNNPRVHKPSTQRGGCGIRISVSAGPPAGLFFSTTSFTTISSDSSKWFHFIL